MQLSFRAKRSAVEESLEARTRRSNASKPAKPFVILSNCGIVAYNCSER